jgi:hypothetical protein
MYEPHLPAFGESTLNTNLPHVNARDFWDQTPLMTAASNCALTMIPLLSVWLM